MLILMSDKIVLSEFIYSLQFDLFTSNCQFKLCCDFICLCLFVFMSRSYRVKGDL